MTKRIVSGVFLLIALGALGLILAGALTSGEQLIVRFLTAIIVAALCLYVISDLRLQADDSSASQAAARKGSDDSRRRSPATSLPPNSTAAFMATVTGKRSATTNQRSDDIASADDDDDSVSYLDAHEEDEDDEVEVGYLTAAASESMVDFGDEIELDADEDGKPEAETLELASAYTHDDVEAEAWPPLPEDPADLDDDEPSTDGLVAIFSKQNADEDLDVELDLEVEHHALVVNDHYRPHTSPVVSGPTLTSIDGGALTISPLPGADAFADDDDTEHSDSEHSDPEGGDTEDSDTEDSDTTASDSEDSDSAESATEDSATEDRATEDRATEDRATEDSDSADSDAAVASDEANLDEDLITLSDPHANPEPEVAPVEATGAEIDPVIQPPLARPAQSFQAMPGLEAAAHARSRVIELLSSDDGVADIEDAIASGELGIITSLMEDGSLSLEGPLTDRDVRTMVFVAFTSSELRKILLSGGRLDGEFDGLELGPVEVFQPEKLDITPAELADPASSASSLDLAVESTAVESTAVEDTAGSIDSDTEADADQHPLVAG